MAKFLRDEDTIDLRELIRAAVDAGAREVVVTAILLIASRRLAREA